MSWIPTKKEIEKEVKNYEALSFLNKSKNGVVIFILIVSSISLFLIGSFNIGIYGIILARSLAPLIIGSISRNYVNSKCFNQPNMLHGFQVLIPLLLIISCALFYEFNITHFGLITINFFLILISFYYFYFKKVKDFKKI